MALTRDYEKMREWVNAMMRTEDDTYTSALSMMKSLSMSKGRRRGRGISEQWGMLSQF